MAHLEIRVKCSAYWHSGKLHVRVEVFWVKCAFGYSGKVRSGNARSGKNRSTENKGSFNSRLKEKVLEQGKCNNCI
jgi:hypothetical protein